MRTLEHTTQIIVTAEFIMMELNASGPATESRLREWLKEQCSSDDVYLLEALAMLTMKQEIYQFELDGEYFFEAL